MQSRWLRNYSIGKGLNKMNESKWLKSEELEALRDRRFRTAELVSLSLSLSLRDGLQPTEILSPALRDRVARRPPLAEHTVLFLILRNEECPSARDPEQVRGSEIKFYRFSEFDGTVHDWIELQFLLLIETQTDQVMCRVLDDWQTSDM